MTQQRFYLINNDCYKIGNPLKPVGIMIHSTGANNPNVNRYVPIGTGYSSNHWNKPGIEKCVHAFIGIMPVGTVGLCQTLPYNFRAWHCGVGTSGKSANSTHIGFECCEDDLSSANYFWSIVDTASDYCASLCKEFGFDPLKDGVIISHHEGYLRGVATGHADIDHWFQRFNYSMDKFRNLVKEKIEGENMTQEQFNQYMDNWLQSRAALAPSAWAVQASTIEWAKNMGLSDGTGPQSFATREQVLTMLKAYDTLQQGMKGVL